MTLRGASPRAIYVFMAVWFAVVYAVLGVRVGFDVMGMMLLRVGVVLVGAVAASFLLRKVACRLDPLWAAGGFVEVDDYGTLNIYRKRFAMRKRLVEQRSLYGVAAVTWDISVFDPPGRLYVKLWDRDPELTFDFLGLGCPAFSGRAYWVFLGCCW